jgi:hypothetical protein
MVEVRIKKIIELCFHGVGSKKKTYQHGFINGPSAGQAELLTTRLTWQVGSSKIYQTPHIH